MTKRQGDVPQGAASAAPCTPPPAAAGTRPRPAAPATDPRGAETPVEIGGPKGPEPTRYGDWERNGRCSDF